MLFLVHSTIWCYYMSIFSSFFPPPLAFYLLMTRAKVKRPDPLGLKSDTVTSPRRLVNTFLTSNSTESK
jgi:hypothetical protein